MSAGLLRVVWWRTIRAEHDDDDVCVGLGRGGEGARVPVRMICVAEQRGASDAIVADQILLAEHRLQLIRIVEPARREVASGDRIANARDFCCVWQRMNSWDAWAGAVRCLVVDAEEVKALAAKACALGGALTDGEIVRRKRPRALAL